MLESVSERSTSIYIHVPFCVKKCNYCAFYSEPAGETLRDRYVRALIRDIHSAAPFPKPLTVFFGGGTPSLLSPRQWATLFKGLGAEGLLGAEEFTVECNPATIDGEKARLLRSFGVNRVSMGVQSFDGALLERLGRIHSREMVFESFETLRKGGFENINLDLMFAIPGQTIEAWRHTLREAVALGSDHLSGYEVIYEEDTPLFAELQAGRIQADEDLSSTMYEEFVSRAGEAGFGQYEVANFARHDAGTARDPLLGLPSRACRHNVNYWRGGAFYGFGPSATSYLGGVRTKNVSDTRAYCERLEQGESPAESREQLSPLARAGETAAFGLRMTAGWPFEQFQAVTGFDLRVQWADSVAECVKNGWGERTDERFRLTRHGLRFADAAAQLFLR